MLWPWGCDVQRVTARRLHGSSASCYVYLLRRPDRLEKVAPSHDFSCFNVYCLDGINGFTGPMYIGRNLTHHNAAINYYHLKVKSAQSIKLNCFKLFTVLYDNIINILLVVGANIIHSMHSKNLMNCLRLMHFSFSSMLSTWVIYETY